jgi:hypothetical protein
MSVAPQAHHRVLRRIDVVRYDERARNDATRQRLAIAHGYAHAVCEPMGTIRVCTTANAKELIERPADADLGSGEQASAEAEVRRARERVPGHPQSRVRPRVVVVLKQGRRLV